MNSCMIMVMMWLHSLKHEHPGRGPLSQSTVSHFPGGGGEQSAGFCIALLGWQYTFQAKPYSF